MFVRLFPVLLLGACVQEPSCGEECFDLEVGTGQDQFLDLAAGGFELRRGAQGAQHIYVSVKGILEDNSLTSDDRAMVTFTWRTADGEAQGEQVVGQALEISEGGELSIVGFPIVIDPPEPYLAGGFELAAEIAPVGYPLTGVGQVSTTVFWGPDDTGVSIEP